jgi:hypothetical protein
MPAPERNDRLAANQRGPRTAFAGEAGILRRIIIYFNAPTISVRYYVNLDG